MTYRVPSTTTPTSVGDSIYAPVSTTKLLQFLYTQHHHRHKLRRQRVEDAVLLHRFTPLPAALAPPLPPPAPGYQLHYYLVTDWYWGVYQAPPAPVNDHHHLIHLYHQRYHYSHHHTPPVEVIVLNTESAPGLPFPLPSPISTCTNSYSVRLRSHRKSCTSSQNHQPHRLRR